jgi:hypothetical protein
VLRSVICVHVRCRVRVTLYRSAHANTHTACISLCYVVYTLCSNVGHADDSDVGLQMALSEQFLRGSAAVTSTGLNFSPAGSLDR